LNCRKGKRKSQETHGLGSGGTTGREVPKVYAGHFGDTKGKKKGQEELLAVAKKRPMEKLGEPYKWV